MHWPLSLELVPSQCAVVPLCPNTSGLLIGFLPLASSSRRTNAGPIAKAEAAGFDASPINGMFGPQMRLPDVRNNSRVMIDDPPLAAELWDRIQVYVPLEFGPWRGIGVNERFRYYRYDLGQQFNWHYDGAYERDNGERSQLTFMIYLNDGFEGGETSFEDAVVVPREGKCAVLHSPDSSQRGAGDPGRKYALRTDVMYRHESVRSVLRLEFGRALRWQPRPPGVTVAGSFSGGIAMRQLLAPALLFVFAACSVAADGQFTVHKRSRVGRRRLASA